MRTLPFMLLVCLVLATDAQAQTTKESQDAAVAEFKKMGGTVTFDEKSPGKPVVSVRLNGTKVTDAGLVHLKELTGLRSLYLHRTQVTDAGLEHLKGLTGLQTLTLYQIQVADAGLVHLKGLTNLQSLFLSFTKVTDAGLVHLKGLTNLQSLFLDGTRVPVNSDRWYSGWHRATTNNATVTVRGARFQFTRPVPQSHR